MGIRGLSLFMSENHHLDNHKLRNCNVIIDGKNLAHTLHDECTGINVAFGGDFDKYANFVQKYFESLRSCGVNALVVMDGAQPLYNKKMKTAQERAVTQIVTCLSVTPENQFFNKVLPPMCLQVFVTTVQKMGILVLQADYEADSDIAALARQLNCIIVSQDTDFYMADVSYVPLASISYKNISPQNYMRCKIFRPNKFCERTGINRSHFPLLGTLMINDYVTKQELANFHKRVAWDTERRRVKVSLNRTSTIRCTIKWMAQRKNKTVGEILNEVAGSSWRLKKKLVNSMKGYTLSKSKLLDNIPYIVHPKKIQNKTVILESTNEYVEYVFDTGSPNALQRSLDLGTDLELKSSGKPPDWFVKAYRENRIPREIADILTNGYFFSPAQVENVSSESSYLVAEPIIHSIFTYLRKECIADRENSQKNDEFCNPSEDGCDILSLPENEEFQSNSFFPSVENEEGAGIHLRTDSKGECGSLPFTENDTYSKFVDDDGDSDIIVEGDSENEDSASVEFNINDHIVKDDDDVDDEEDDSEVVDKANQENFDDQSKSINSGTCENDCEEKISPLQGSGNIVETLTESKECIDFTSRSHAKTYLCDEKKESKISHGTDSSMSKSSKSKPRKNKSKCFLKWYIRQGKSLWCKNLRYQEENLDAFLPSLKEVEFLSVTEKKLVFYKMLHIDSEFKDHDMPSDLELILNCIIYWFRNSREILSDCHVLTVLVCVFMYYIIDSKIGRVRSLKGFENVKASQEKISALLKEPTYTMSDASEIDLLINLSSEECLVAANNLFMYHHMDQMVRGKNYNRKIVHAFSEYQACVYFVQILNSLLCSPFPFLCIEYLWGGTFGYNVFNELSQRANRLSKVVEILGQGTCLERLFTKLFRKLEEILKFTKIAVNKTVKKNSKKRAADHKKRIKQWEEAKGGKTKDSPKVNITKDKIEKDLVCLLDNRFAGMAIDSDSGDDE